MTPRARLAALQAQLRHLGAAVTPRDEQTLSRSHMAAICAAEAERLRVLTSPEADIWLSWLDHMPWEAAA